MNKTTRPQTKTKSVNAPTQPGAYRPRILLKTAPTDTPPIVPAERITEGLIRMADSAAAEALPLYYYADAGKWYAPNGQGGFARFKDSHASALVAEHGFNRSIKDAQGNTPADRVMLWLMQNRSVAFAGLLAGYAAGFHEVDGGRFLVTESPRTIPPVPGDWPTIRQLVNTMLADEKHDQENVFYTWAAESYAAFWQRMTQPGPWPFRHCPALGIFGPRHCGKSALIDLVLTPLFGGRKGDPLNFLKEGRFNKDWASPGLMDTLEAGR